MSFSHQSISFYLLGLCTDRETGGSGANAPAYISAPFDAIQEQAYQDGTSLLWDFTTDAPAVDASTDACLVFINAFAAEGNDRPGLRGSYPLSSLVSFIQIIYFFRQTTIPMASLKTLLQLAAIPS